MKRIKLFENFQNISFEEIDDMLYKLQDKEILSIKNKPYFSWKEDFDGEEEGLRTGTPKIYIRYYIREDLGKIDSIKKLDTLVELLDNFKDAISRLDEFSEYLIDLGRKELEISLSVPNNIKDLFDRVSLDLYGEKYIYDEDIDDVPYDVELEFKVDEKLNITVSVKIKTKGVIDTIKQLEESLKKHFSQYSLEFIESIDKRGTWIFNFACK
jgi:hypothetical protein